MLANVLLRVLSYLFLEQNARSLQQPSSAAIFPGTVFLGALSWGRPTLSPLHPCSTEGGGRRKKPPKRGGWKWCGQALPHQVRVLFGAPGAGMQERAPEGSWRPKISGLARDTGDGDGGSSPRRNTSLRRSYPGLPDRSLRAGLPAFSLSLISFQFAGTLPASSQPPSRGRTRSDSLSLLSEDTYRGWNPALPNHPSQTWLMTSLFC